MVFGLEESVNLLQWKSRIDLSKPRVCDFVFIPEPDDLGEGRYLIVRL